MSRRRRKQKLKKESKPATQVQIQVETAPVVLPVEEIEIQVEVEESISPIETAEEAPAAIAPEVKETRPEVKAATGADRRTHIRYAFNAAVEVVETGSGARMETWLRDLSQQGCYVGTTTPLALGIETYMRITKSGKSFEARARVVYNQPGKGMGLMFTSVRTEQLATLHAWIAESRETSWLAANRRRSQRVLMRIPVLVSGRIGVASPFEEETHTRAVSAHGAMVMVAAPVYRGQQFTLLNMQTKASLECVVVHIDTVVAGEPNQVGVEFLLPNPTFWRVAFPPKDWTPRHPDAKSG